MPKPRVLITGAAGEITRQLLPAFRERYDLVLLDTRRSEHASDIIITDISDPDIEVYRDYFRGVDAIVHNVRSTQPGVKTSAPRQWIAERPGSEPVEGYFVERKSVDMAFNVLRLAMEENVRRVVLTSSNHAADWYETKLHNGELDTIGPETYPLSDNFYGWAKATYEHLGFLFATGRLGRVVENVQVRVGAPRPIHAPTLMVTRSATSATSAPILVNATCNNSTPSASRPRISATKTVSPSRSFTVCPTTLVGSGVLPMRGR